jgi:hypothetical protein
MYARVAAFRSRLSLVVLALSALLATACGDDGENVVRVHKAADAGMAGRSGGGVVEPEPDHACDAVELDGDLVLEHERDYTATYRRGEPYEKTLMLFGGEQVEEANALSNAYIFGLDKADALMLAQKYPDFSQCSSPGGMEASMYIVSYDLVPATCEVYDLLVKALQQYTKNLAAGSDRTSLRLEGAPLQLESVIADATGEDATDDVAEHNFHLVTGVEQLTGESVISFGSSP